MELTKKQIQKINTFLESIGMEFIDVRYEMIDHIASEIEEKITDTTSFFENRKLQTPFLKYMLSRKKEFSKMYKTQERKKFWSAFILIFKDVKSFLLKPIFVFSIVLFVALVILTTNYQLKTTLLFLLISTIVLGVITSVYYYKTFKKLGKVRLAATYYFLLWTIPNLSILAPNWIAVFKENQYHFYYVYFYLAFFLLEFFVCLSFYKRKEKILEQHQIYIA